jgi:hypothetical protein
MAEDLSSDQEVRARRAAKAIYDGIANSKDPAYRTTVVASERLKNVLKGAPQYRPYFQEFASNENRPDLLSSSEDSTPTAKVPAPPQTIFTKPAAKTTYTAPKPTPSVIPQTSSPTISGAFASNPEAFAAHQKNLQNSGPTWSDRTADLGKSLIEHFLGGGVQENPIVHTHWLAGSGGVSGGNNARMLVTRADGSQTWVEAGAKPGEFVPSAPTTLDKQNQLLQQANTPEQRQYGGILPSWNSPTGKAIDTSTMTELPSSDVLPQKGWLNQAVAAARGAESSTARTATFATPSGGSATISNPNAQNKADVAQIIANKTQPGYRQTGTGEEYQGRNLTGTVVNY